MTTNVARIVKRADGTVSIKIRASDLKAARLYHSSAGTPYKSIRADDGSRIVITFANEEEARA